jgi:hypothetical protein
MRLLALSFLLLLALPGCAQGSSGALGQTEASPDCPPSDLMCSVSGIDAPIAKGTSLSIHVSVTAQGSAAPPLSFASANPAVFTVDDGRIHAMGKGLASLLVTTDKDLVVDFLHVFVAEPDSLRLHRLAQSGLETSPLPPSMQMLVGDEIILVAAPHADAQRLLGDADATWDADPQIVTLVDQGTPGSRRVVAKAPGKTSVKASALGMETLLSLEVLP